MASKTNPDEILARLAPRMAAAKRSYLRRRLVVLFAIPFLLTASAAWAAVAPRAEISQVASAPEDSTDDQVDEPTVVDEDPVVEPTVEPVPAWETVPLGVLGKVQVRETKDGLELGESDLPTGWDIRIFKTDDERLVLILEHDDVRILATISPESDALVVHLEDVTPHKPQSSPTPKPDVQTRKEIAVGDYGTVVVERDGEELVLVVTWSHQWWEPVVVVERGAVVHAYFANDGYEKHVEAWIDGTEIKHETSLVEPEPKPEPEPEPEVQTRKEIAVGDYGTVVVERDGGQLWLGVTWSHQWWEPVVVVEHGESVHAYFTNDGVEKHVRAWIDGTKIKHETWVVQPEPELQTRKEIGVYEIAGVVVEREGDSNQLWLGVTWTHESYDSVVVTEHGELVHAYFTNDGYEKHVKAWTDGPYIKHETWIVEPEVASYSGTVECEFGNIDVLVEGNIARITAVHPIEGVTANVLVEVGETVKVEYVTESEVWHVVAWGNGHEVLYEAYVVD